MKCFVIVFLFTLTACGADNNQPITRLLTEQKRFKDSLNTINAKIGYYIKKGFYDSAETQKIQLHAVYDRLAALQSSIDNRSK